MSHITLPDGVLFRPVAPFSIAYQMGVACRLSSFSVALGSSYFQRLLAVIPSLAANARRCPAFSCYCDALPDGRPGAATAPPPPDEAASMDINLRSALFTCTFLAAKVSDRAQPNGLLSTVLSVLSLARGRRAVSLEQAAAVEMRCLEGLGWRLGPHFSEGVDLGGGTPAVAGPLGDPGRSRRVGHNALGSCGR